MARWTYNYSRPDFTAFWKGRLEDASLNVLAIVGIGFDPRSILALQALGGLGVTNRVGVLALELPAGDAAGGEDPRIASAFRRNISVLDSPSGFRVEARHRIETHDSEGHHVAGRRVLDSVSQSVATLSSYSDIIVDISGLPRGAFFPLVAYLVKLSDEGRVRNLHVVVVEDPDLDSQMTSREYGPPDYIHTFRDSGGGKCVWLPVLGGNSTVRLDKLYGMLGSECAEIFPILPFPGTSLRRVDDIALAHADLLFESFLVGHDNLLLCDERSPFDVYERILEVAEYYETKVSGVQGVGHLRTILSPLSSKTMSLGILLAAIERRLPVCHVEPGSYVLTDGAVFEVTAGCQPMDIWLTGEPYNA